MTASDSSDNQKHPRRSVFEPQQHSKVVAEPSLAQDSADGTSAKTARVVDNSDGELREQILTILVGFGVSGGRFQERTENIMALIAADRTGTIAEYQRTTEAIHLQNAYELGRASQPTNEGDGE